MLVDRPLLYFICRGNAMRSQMAEAWLRHLALDSFDVASAGTHPFGSIPADVHHVMEEAGVRMTDQFSKGIDPELIERAALVVDLDGGALPRMPAEHDVKYLAWRVDDPYGMSIDAVRVVRDDIRRRVERLVAAWSDAPLEREQQDMRR